MAKSSGGAGRISGTAGRAFGQIGRERGVVDLFRSGRTYITRSGKTMTQKEMQEYAEGLFRRRQRLRIIEQG